jgi:hypothetical protein
MPDTALNGLQGKLTSALFSILGNTLNPTNSVTDLVGVTKALLSGQKITQDPYSGAVIAQAAPGTIPDTSGSVINMPSDAGPTMLPHEMEHVRQDQLLGPLVGVIKGISHLVSPNTEDFTNPLELDAYAAEPPGQQKTLDSQAIKSFGGNMAIYNLLNQLHGYSQ